VLLTLHSDPSSFILRFFYHSFSEKNGRREEEDEECVGRDNREEKKEGSMWWVPYSYGAVTKINDLTAFAIQLPRIGFFFFSFFWFFFFRLIWG